MLGITYDDKNKLIDNEYLKENITVILSLNEYIPSILTSVFYELFSDSKSYSQWKSSITPELNKVYIKQKVLRGKLSKSNINGKQGKSILPILLELMVFITKHSEFEGVIKDMGYLEELIQQCEIEYQIDMFDYIESYDDFSKLID